MLNPGFELVTHYLQIDFALVEIEHKTDPRQCVDLVKNLHVE